MVLRHSGGILQRAGATLAGIGRQAPRVHSLPLFYEDWRDGFVDASKWTYAVGTGGLVGSAVNKNAAAGSINVGYLECNATADTAWLATRTPYVIPSGQTALTTIIERLNLEFTAVTTGAASVIDNTKFLMGFGDTQGNLRTSNNVLGFYLASDVLRALTDLAGTETTAALTTAPTITTLHKYKISIDRVNGALFFVDGVQQAALTTNIQTSFAYYVNFYYQHDSAGDQRLDIGTVRVWLEDLI